MASRERERYPRRPGIADAPAGAPMKRRGARARLGRTLMTDSGHCDLEARTEPRILERSEHPVSRRDIDPRVLKVLYRLIDAGHDAYLVGAGVRDLMIGPPPKTFPVAPPPHPP